MKKILSFVLITYSLAACKKSGNTPTPVIPVCAISSSTVTGAYKITASKYKASAGTADSDLYADLPACKKDDIYRFNTDGTFTVTDAGVSCGTPPGPGAIDGWTLNSSNTILQIAGINYTIESFNCTDLVIYESNVASSGDKKTTTYSKQ